MYIFYFLLDKISVSRCVHCVPSLLTVCGVRCAVCAFWILNIYASKLPFSIFILLLNVSSICRSSDVGCMRSVFHLFILFNIILLRLSRNMYIERHECKSLFFFLRLVLHFELLKMALHFLLDKTIGKYWRLRPIIQ